MQTYPIVSIILVGDNSIDEIDLSLKSFRKIKYPQDQMEFYLIIPYHRPISEYTRLFPKLRMIRFDCTLNWSIVDAQKEGLSFTQGEYIQVSNAGYSLHPDWLKTGLKYFQDSTLVSVQSIDIDNAKYESNNDLILLKDGLYEAKIAKQFMEDNLEKSKLSHLFRNAVLTISEPMINKRLIKKSQKNHQYLFSNRLRAILSKYVLAK